MFILLCILSIFLRFKSDSEWVTRRRNVFKIYDSFRTRRDFIFSGLLPRPDLSGNPPKGELKASHPSIFHFHRFCAGGDGN